MGRPARLGHENQQGSGANLPFYILQLFTIFGTDYVFLLTVYNALMQSGVAQTGARGTTFIFGEKVCCARLHGHMKENEHELADEKFEAK